MDLGGGVPFNVEPAVNRQPGFRRELVEQSTHLIISFMNFFSESYSFPLMLNSLFCVEHFQNFLKKYLIVFNISWKYSQTRNCGFIEFGI
jgi:hypothetical protein